MLALYLTIWIALALFVAGEVGRSTRGSAAGPSHPPPAWAWWVFTAGLVLALVHTAIAFDLVHDWVHDDAVRNTAMQTKAVFGTAVGWGVYVNYVFFAAWLADAVWWRAGHPGASRPAPLTWTLRLFYLVIILNAAVIFAAPQRRAIGLLMIAALAWAWRPRRLLRRDPAHRRRGTVTPRGRS